MSSLNDAAHPAGLHRLPFRIRDSSAHSSHTKASSTRSNSTKDAARSKHCPESLHLLSSHARIRSPTESSMSTLSSVPDSATTASLSTVASPLSSSYTGDFPDLTIGSRPSSRVFHRHQASSGTCSTFVNDEDDVPVIAEYPDFQEKVRRYQVTEVRPGSKDGHETLPVRSVSPSTEAPPVKGEQSEPLRTFYEESPPCASPAPPQKAVQTAPFEDCAPEDCSPEDGSPDVCSPEDADSILDYTLQLVYGVDAHDASVSPAESRRIVHKFIRELGHTIWHSAPDSQTAQAMSTSASNSSTPGGSGTGESQRGGKRKKQNGAGRGGNDDGDEFSDGDGESFMPVKRPRPNPRDDENLRLSCPFRKRNPQRFNVRDHHSCAMTYFPKFAELRQHIAKQHKRDDPAAYVCDRCNRDFSTRKELRDHQRLPREQICEISDNDPESGIDGPTSTKLLSRKRASGTSPEVQWREIWNILFPDDDDHLVPTYHFTPVIEHFELSTSYLSCFNLLRSSLRDKMSNPATLETLATKFHQCFVEAVERCIADAQNMPYANRSNKRGEQLAAAAAVTQPRKSAKDLQPRPDSGVVITDDGSDESGSVMGGPLAPSLGARAVGGSQRGSNSGPSTARDLVPARTPSAIFDPQVPLAPSSTPMTVGSASVAPTDVQAWNNGVMYPVQGIPSTFGVPPGDLNMAQDFNAFDQSFYTPHPDTRGMGNEFSGFF